MILPNPDVIIFIDYPGFNMRIAKWAREKHPNTLLHIAPNMGLEKIASLTSKKDVDKCMLFYPLKNIL
jgi:lipid-A-disaccharide synthase